MKLPYTASCALDETSRATCMYRRLCVRVASVSRRRLCTSGRSEVLVHDEIGTQVVESAVCIRCGLRCFRVVSVACCGDMLIPSTSLGERDHMGWYSGLS